MTSRERIDKVLVDRGFVRSRERAKAFVMEGKVIVDGECITKAGTLVLPGAEIRLKDDDIPYVSRGGLKLEGALDHFRIDPAGKTVMDIGSSTGGFTDCILKKGAKKVYAIDVGYGQFDWSLRKDPRIVLFEKTNIRYLEKDRVPESIDLAVIDVSFISLLKVLPKTIEFLHDNGEVLALVKPQFEVGRESVEKGGIIRDEKKRMAAVDTVREGAGQIGLRAVGVYESPVRGQKGNREYFLYLRRD